MGRCLTSAWPIALLLTVASLGAVQATTIEFFTVPTQFDRLVPATDNQFDGGFDNTYGTIPAAGITNYNTPNIVVDWGVSDAGNNAGGSNHWLATPPINQFSTDSAFYTPNDPFSGTGPGTFFTTTPLSLTATGGFLGRFDSITVDNSDPNNVGSLNVQVFVDSVLYNFNAVLAPAQVFTFNLSAAPAGSNVQLFLNSTTITVNQYQIDDVVFSQVSAPTPAVPDRGNTILLFGLSTAGLFFAGRCTGATEASRRRRHPV